MNRRLLLIVACAVLPSTTLGAQIVQPGEASADHRAQGGRADEDERKARKKGTLGELGFGLGAGAPVSFRSDAERVTQQDFCIGACGPLRASSRISHVGAPGEHVSTTSSSSHYTNARHGGVLALLESLGNVSDHAIDAVTNARGHATVAGDGMPVNASVTAHRASGATGKAATSTPDIADRSHFDAAMNGCVLGCQPPASARVYSSAPGAEEGLFAAASSAGPVVLAGGDVNTIVNPEPSTVVLMLSGLAAMAAIARRKRSVG